MTYNNWFLLDVNPQPWAIGPVGYGRRGGKMSAYVGRNQQLHAYEQAIKEEITSQLPSGFQMYEGKVSLYFAFWRNRPDYTTPQSRTHRNHEADLTNLVKTTEDALQDVLFKNDKDNNQITAVMVNQGAEVYGKVILGVGPSTPHPMPEVPTHLLMQGLELEVQPSPSENKYGTQEELF